MMFVLMIIDLDGSILEYQRGPCRELLQNLADRMDCRAYVITAN